jgi:RNA polymerase sigma-70 factor (ECF subfamily)
MRFGFPRSDRLKKIEGFEALAKGSESALYRVAYRLAGNSEDAKDLLQEALVEAFQAFEKFRPGADFARWVSRIMTHTYIDGTRRKAVRPQTVPMLEIGSSESSAYEVDFPDRSPGPEQRLLTAEFKSHLDDALARLPAEYRTALVLCDMEGFAYAEAAEAMGCPEGTVRSRLHRARRALRVWLEPYLSGLE